MRRFIFFAFSFQQGTAAPLHPPLENSGSIGGLRTSCEKILFCFSFQQGAAAPLHPLLENNGSLGGLRTSCEKIIFCFSFQQEAAAPLHPPLENSGSIGGLRTSVIPLSRFHHCKSSRNARYVSMDEPSKFGAVLRS